MNFLSEELLRHEAEKLFRTFDVDVNGQLDRDELSNLHSAMHEILGLFAASAAQRPSPPHFFKGVEAYDV